MSLFFYISESSVISLLKMTPRKSTEAVSSVLNCMKTVMCLYRKMHVSLALGSFSVHESVYIKESLSRNT